MVIAGVVEYEEHATAAALIAQQSLEEGLECLGVEDGAHHAYELTRAQADRAEARHGLAGRCMLQDGVLDLRRYPHSAAGAMLLEVAFIEAPEFDVGASRQTAEFFLPPRLSADRPERLADAACVAESPTGGTSADIAGLPGPRHTAGAGVPPIPGRPRAWPPSQSRAGSCADPPAAAASPSHQGSAAAPIAPLPARRPVRLARSGVPTAAPSSRPRQTALQLPGKIAPLSPAATRAVDGRNATPRYARSPAGSRFASPQHPRFAACASFYSPREERRNHISMLHYLCRYV